MIKRRILIIVAVVVIVSLLFLLGIWVYLERSRQLLIGNLVITDDALSTGIHHYAVGDFVIHIIATGQEHPGGYLGPRLVVTHSSAPGRWLWHTSQGQSFAAAAQGQETVKEIRGSFSFKDNVTIRCADQTIDSLRAGLDEVVISGILTCDSQEKVGYTLTFKTAGDHQVEFDLSLDDPTFNRTFLTYASDSGEHFFGFGEQFSYFDHKGQVVPVWVSEQGIGRGLQPLTFLVDRIAGSGGNAYTTYAAIPHYMTSRLRSLFLTNSEYTVFNLSQPEQVQIEVYSRHMNGRILFGQSPEDLIMEYTSWAGRMRPLPEWILSGAVLGLQGGTSQVREVYDQLKKSGAPVSALWLQDWVGQRKTSFGKQLWWNWELDEDHYPEWESLRDDLESDGVRLMVYTNPFLADVSLKENAHRNLFQEAKELGYLVKQTNGQPYLVQNTDFSAGMIDLTNPDAWLWYQDVLRKQMVEKTGASGWMADFGEALPYDSFMADSSSGAEFHNLYPQIWAKFNRELVDSLPNSAEVTFFQRAAFLNSPAYTTLFWEGDQLVTWDEYDGIKSAVTGMLSGGISGMSLNHSDIGGYTTIDNTVARFHRSKELLFRWMELSAMTTVFRSHEGNIPEANAQIYTDAETIQHFSRMAKVYAAWKPVRMKLVEEASRTGMPVARHLFLHYPDDEQVYQLSFQEYMLGNDLLVAPVLEPDQTDKMVYLPAGNWVHIWTGRIYHLEFEGKWVKVASPSGEPPVFYREGSSDGMMFKLNLERNGVIP